MFSHCKAHPINCFWVGFNYHSFISVQIFCVQCQSESDLFFFFFVKKKKMKVVRRIECESSTIYNAQIPIVDCAESSVI